MISYSQLNLLTSYSEVIHIFLTSYSQVTHKLFISSSQPTHNLLTINLTINKEFSFQSIEGDKSYNVIDIIEDGETSLMTTGGTLLKLANNHVAIYTVEFEEKHRIQNCHQFSDLMTNCILNNLKKKHENNTFMQYVDMALSRVSGFEHFAKYTGCLQPCQRTVYKSNEYFSAPIEFTNNPEAQEPFPQDQDGQPLGSLLMINHVKQATFAKHKEQYQYDIQSYIADVGGISGIFLGFSFLSFYEILVHPIIQKLFNSKLK